MENVYFYIGNMVKGVDLSLTRRRKDTAHTNNNCRVMNFGLYICE